MRRIRRCAAAGAGALGLVGALSGLALADAPTKTGWWNASTAGGVALPMPTTGADDLHVSQGPSGPAAYGAVAYPLLGGTVTGATLQLAVVPNTAVGTVDVAACPTKDASWPAGGNQSYDARPQYDCAKGVPGIRAADGASVSFLLDAGQLLPTGGYSLAIVPADAALPFSVDFAKPAATSLEVQVDAAPEPAAPAPFETPAPPPAQGTSGGAPLSPGTSADAPVLGPAAPAPLTAPVAPAPQAAAAPVAPDPVRAAAATPIDNRDRYAAGSLLALLAGAVVWAFQQPSSSPRLIGGMARKAPPTPAPVTARPRGIGRFATLRTAPARRLV